jgi:hypothetical protein
MTRLDGANPDRESLKSDGLAGLALPNYQHGPTGTGECVSVPLVSGPVSSYLWGPILNVGFNWAVAIDAMRATMPKAPVNEYTNSPRRKHDVGAAG